MCVGDFQPFLQNAFHFHSKRKDVEGISLGFLRRVPLARHGSYPARSDALRDVLASGTQQITTSTLTCKVEFFGKDMPLDD